MINTKKVKTLLNIVITFLLSFSLVCVVNAESSRGVTDDEGKILIPVEKKWSNVLEEDRPQSVRIKLYKYLGTLNTNATPIRTIELDSTVDWKGNFDISDQDLVDSSDNHYKFAIVEESITGYQEIVSEHVDPNVVFTPPSLDNAWERITPCSELNITSNGDFKLTVIVKKGSKYIVWTHDALTAKERHMMYESTLSINGMHGAKESSFTFISGYGGSLRGLTVTEDTIHFDASSNFSMLATGFYYKSSTEANASSVTNEQSKISLVVEKKWEDHQNILGLRPISVDVQLYNGDTPIGEAVTLSEANHWKHEFTGLKEYIDGVLNNYSIREVDSGIYTSSSVVNGNKTTITNTYEVVPTTVKVNKVWKNTSGFISTLPGVIVDLCYKTNENDTCKKIASVVLNQNNSWTYTFTSGQDGEKEFDILPSNYIYEVREAGYQGLSEEDKFFFQEFIKTTITHSGNNYTITNTCTASYDLPETGSKGALILGFSTSLLIGVPIVYLAYSLFEKVKRVKNN